MPETYSICGQLIPIEVKSADNTKAKSLNIYIDAYSPAYAIKLSATRRSSRSTLLFASDKRLYTVAVKLGVKTG